MATTAVLDQSTTIRTRINTVSLSNQSVAARSNDSHSFGNYQLITIGASEATICTLVSVPISVPLYRKTLIIKHVLRQILEHSTSPSIKIRNLMSTVARYFDISASMTETDMERAADSIRSLIFRVDNMTEVGFLKFKGKLVTIDDPSHRQPNVEYFTFRFTITPYIVDPSAQDTIHQF